MLLTALITTPHEPRKRNIADIIPVSVDREVEHHPGRDSRQVYPYLASVRRARSPTIVVLAVDRVSHLVPSSVQRVQR
jgi:hypothetical protein